LDPNFINKPLKKYLKMIFRKNVHIYFLMKKET